MRSGASAPIGAVVAARMSSARCPGKALALLGDRPLLELCIDSLRHCRGLDLVAVATSEDASDDPIDRLCARLGIPCHRGPVADVGARLLGAAEALGLGALVRVSGDSPLIDHRVVDAAVALLRAADLDAVSNVRPRTFPAGQSVEVLTVDALRRVHAAAADDADREHVTPPLYRDLPGLRIGWITTRPARPELRMVVDTPEDLVAMRRLVSSLAEPPHRYGWRRLAARMAAAARAA